MTEPAPRNRHAGVSTRDRTWVTTQYVLFMVVLFGGPIEWLVLGHMLWLPALWSAAIGVVMIIVSLVILNSAARSLAGNLTAYPTPVEGGTLVDTGLYGLVRHPIYLGVLAGTLGYAFLFGSRLVLVIFVVFIPFFLAKAVHEERMLREAYPEYAAYSSKVRKRLIPFLL